MSIAPLRRISPAEWSFFSAGLRGSRKLVVLSSFFLDEIEMVLICSFGDFAYVTSVLQAGSHDSRHQHSNRHCIRFPIHHALQYNRPSAASSLFPPSLPRQISPLSKYFPSMTLTPLVGSRSAPIIRLYHSSKSGSISSSVSSTVSS